MSLAATRFASGLLVLLACAIAAWRSSDHTPTRMVVELVSVVSVPARVEAQPAAEPAAAPAAPQTPQSVAVRAAPPKKPPQKRAPLVAQHPKAVVRVSCRPPACQTAATAPAKKAGIKPLAHQQETKAQEPVPAVFVPLRNLGLRLQARVNPPQDPKAAPARQNAETRRSNG